MVGAVEGEVAQGGELGLDAVLPRAVGRRVGELNVVGYCPVADPGVVPRGQVLGEVVEHDRDPDRRWVEAAQVAAELEKPRPVLLGLDVPVELVLAQVVGGEQMSDPVWAGVGCSPAGPGFTPGVLVSSSALGPLPTRVRLEVQGPELVEAEDVVGLAVVGYDLDVADRIEVFDAGLLCCIVGGWEVFQVFMR
jgi:hypothetical protein